MKIESYAMSNNEVLRALRMFIDDKWDDGMFHLISIESILEDGGDIAGFITSKSNTEIPNDTIVQVEQFCMKFDNEWIVYVLYMQGEVCGLIAFSDWD